MKNTPFYHIVVFTILFSSFAQATTPFTLPHKSDKAKESHTLTFEQNHLSKKITLNSYNSSYTIEIFDTEGNVVKTLKMKKNSKLEVSTTNIKSGKYYLRYIGKDKKNNSVKVLFIK